MREGEGTMLNIILGLCMLCLGILGVVWNWWAVVDLVTVVIPLLLVIRGVLSILAGLSPKDQARARRLER
jgi:uncharacterized membrane protein HdeD (DUF308 family)